MIRRAALAAAGLLLALAACDRGHPPAGFAGPAAPALFEIAGPGGAVEGWLFGTIHSLPGGVSWETETLADALAAADVLVVEVRDLEDGAALRRAFERRAYSAPRPPLAERVPPSLRPRLESLMAEGSMPAGALDRMETWAAALTLAQLGQAGKAENGVDRALVRRMGAGAVVELEGAGAQLDIFDRLPEREQRDLLAAVIADLADRQAGAQANAARWYRGDIGHLADPATFKRRWRRSAQRSREGALRQRPLSINRFSHRTDHSAKPAIRHFDPETLFVEEDLGANRNAFGVGEPHQKRLVTLHAHHLASQRIAAMALHMAQVTGGEDARKAPHLEDHTEGGRNLTFPNRARQMPQHRGGVIKSTGSCALIAHVCPFIEHPLSAPRPFMRV